MSFFTKNKTTTILVDDGFLLPEHFYVWMENASYKEHQETCLWQQLNQELRVKKFSASLLAKSDLAQLNTGMVMRADPVHITADWQGLSVTDNHPKDLSLEDATALCQEVQQDLGPYTIHCPDPYRWYISAPTLEKFPATPTLCTLGQKTHEIQELPHDLHQKINQLQISLHHHPINIKREKMGLATVNSLWCWGVDTYKNTASCRSKDTTIISENPEVIVYSKALKIPTLAMSQCSQYLGTKRVVILDSFTTEVGFELLEAPTVQIYYRGIMYFN